MGFRETLQKNTAAATFGAGMFLLICVTVIALEFKAQRGPNFSAVGKVFYSDDDGKTWYLDYPSNGSPYEHDGKQAYRALVFRCSSGGPFVAYLAKYSEHQLAQMSADMAQAPAGTPVRMYATLPNDLKKPGDSTWVPNSSPAPSGYPAIKCSDGSGFASIVMSADPNAGARQ